LLSPSLASMITAAVTPCGRNSSTISSTLQLAMSLERITPLLTFRDLWGLTLTCTSSGNNSKHAATAQRQRRDPGCPCNDQILTTDGCNSNLSSSRSCFHFHCTAFGFNAKQEREGRIKISAIGRCDLVVAAAAWNPPPPLCCCSMFRVVTAGRG